ncbi:MAG TPA: hypothetical protein VG253_15110 [Streptosporangiaceae bacterium]|nr:hypothetical protein [Streptosporangiaceae bacterium]
MGAGWHQAEPGGPHQGLAAAEHQHPACPEHSRELAVQGGLGRRFQVDGHVAAHDQVERPGRSRIGQQVAAFPAHRGAYAARQRPRCGRPLPRLLEPLIQHIRAEQPGVAECAQAPQYQRQAVELRAIGAAGRPHEHTWPPAEQARENLFFQQVELLGITEHARHRHQDRTKQGPPDCPVVPARAGQRMNARQTLTAHQTLNALLDVLTPVARQRDLAGQPQRLDVGIAQRVQRLRRQHVTPVAGLDA